MFITIKNNIFRIDEIKLINRMEDTLIVFTESNDQGYYVKMSSVKEAEQYFEFVSQNLGSISMPVFESKANEVIDKLDIAIESAKETISSKKDKFLATIRSINLGEEVQKLRSALDINKALSSNSVNEENFGFDKHFTDEDVYNYSNTIISEMELQYVIDLTDKILAQEINTNEDIKKVISMIKKVAPNTNEANQNVRAALLDYRDELVEWITDPCNAFGTIEAALNSRKP